MARKLAKQLRRAAELRVREEDVFLNIPFLNIPYTRC
jgi:hypothetical protein